MLETRGQVPRSGVNDGPAAPVPLGTGAAAMPQEALRTGAAGCARCSVSSALQSSVRPRA